MRNGIMVLASLAAWFAWIWVWNMKVTLSPLQGDAACFVPAARSLAEGQGLRNPVYHPGHVADKNDPTRLNWHGPVAPHVWAWLASDDSYLGVKRGGFKTAVLGLLAMLIALCRKVWSSRQTSWMIICMPAWIILGSGWIFTHNGRPESVAAAAAVLTLAILPSSLSALWSCLAGAGLGLVVATAPAAGLILTPLVTLTVALGAPASVLWSRLLIVSGVAFAVCGLAVEVLGFGVREWIEAMRLHGGEVIADGHMSSLKPYWLILPDSPLLILSLLALLGVVWWSRARREVALMAAQKFVISASLVALCMAVFVALIRISTNYYNILPALACLILVAAWQWLQRPLRATSFALLLALALPVVGFARSAMVLCSAAAHGLACDQAKQHLAEDLAKVPSNQSVALGHALFELADAAILSGRQVRVSHDMEFSEDCVVLQQAGMASVEPPALSGYVLMADRFVRHVPRAAGVKLASSTGAFGYAIYVRGK